MTKNKEAIKEYGKRYPHTSEMIIAELKICCLTYFKAKGAVQRQPL